MQSTEAILEPALPIIDPHHHLWEGRGQPPSPYMLEELLGDIGSGHNIAATLYVECGSGYRPGGPEHLASVGETEFAKTAAERSSAAESSQTRICAGIVGFADLTRGAAVDEVLEAHLQVAPGRFRGIRNMSAWHEDAAVLSIASAPELLGDSRFRAEFARLPRYGLTFDAWLYHMQIPEITDLARAHPEVAIVLDHLGTPLDSGPYKGKRSEVFPLWKKNISELASCSNVNVKLGGMYMPMTGFDGSLQLGSQELAAATRDYFLHTIDCFGPRRCMFESNFPVDRISCSYAVLWNSFKRIVADFTPEEKRALFHDTAARVYRLSDI